MPTLQLFLLTLTAAVVSVHYGGQVPVPHGLAPVVDGTVSTDEWKGSWRTDQNGSALMLRHDGDDVFVAVVARQFAITSMYIAKADELKVLHASAAIGDAVYRRDPGGAWRLHSTFAWTRYRDPADLAARGQAFFKEHGWVGSHMRLGAPGDTELRVSARELEGARVAVTYYEPESRTLLLAYPAGLSGDVVAHEIQAGYTPDVLRIQPEAWVTLKKSPPSAG